MSTAIELACAAAMRNIKKHINATAGQHMRAIRKGFALAGAPVTATVEPEAQRRIPLVSEGTASARRINREAGAPACAASGCNGPVEGQCLGICTGGMR